MDISKQFSLTDFLAYFFPGTLSVLGIYTLLLLTPIQSKILNISVDLTAGVIYLAVSYVVGVIFSGLSSNIINGVEKLQRYKDVKKTIPFENYRESLLRAFRTVFDNSVIPELEWSRTEYYLCRALVSEKMPVTGLHIDRQSSFAIFRRNLIMPIIIWLVCGIGWGIYLIWSGLSGWGGALIIVSLVLFGFSFRTTIVRMHESEIREVREVLLGFLTGYELGLFDKRK